MVDNVQITEGTGTAIHADEYTHGTLGSGKTQLVKIVDGVLNAETALSVKTQATFDGTLGGVIVFPLDFFITVQTDVTRPGDTAVYAINDCISNSTSAPTTFTFTNAARKSGGSGIITDLIVITSNDPATTLQGDVFIYNQSVTSPNDNAAFAISDADAKFAVGKVPFALEDIGNNGFFHAQNLCIGYTCVGTANLRFLLRARNAYTPANAEVITVTIKCQQID